jgi:hypothetical protein
MIDLPDFKNQFFYENNFYLSCDKNRLAKVYAQFELFQRTINLPGDIVECGVFKGTSLVRFANMRELFCNSSAKKIIGFDAFGEFPETEFELDKKSREKFISDSGQEGIGQDQLMEVLRHKEMDKNVELVPGDINKTLSNYIDENPSLRISFLNIDVDVYEPTKACLDLLFDKVVKGGIILLDDYCSLFPGANKAVEDFLQDKDYTPQRLPYSVTPCFIKK